jgi:drug/metabolite transporter (DMT)-like permease
MTGRAVPIGLRYMAEGALYWSIMSVCVKAAGARGVPWEQIVFARASFALVVTFIWLRAVGVSPWGQSRGWLAIRGLFGTAGLMCFYYSVTHLPLGDATVIQYTNPAFVALFAVAVAGERLRVGEVAAALLCLIGVVFIARPSFIFGGESALPVFPVLVAVGGAVASAVAYAAVRRLGRTDYPLVVVLWFPLIATPITLPLALATSYVPGVVDLGLMAAVGLSSQMAQVRITQGLKLERAGRATTITYLQVVFAFLWGVTFFDEVPTLWTVVGTCVVIGTTLVLAVRREGAQEDREGGEDASAA